MERDLRRRVREGLVHHTFARSRRSRAAVVTVDGSRLIVEPLDGPRATYALADVKSWSGLNPRRIHIDSDVVITVWLHNEASRRLIGALFQPMNTRASNEFFRRFQNAMRRAIVLMLLPLWPGYTWLRWSNGATNGVQIPGWPLLSAAISAGFGVVLMLLFLEVAVLRQAQIVRWVQRRLWRRERAAARMARVAGGQGAWA